jgi:hypothetical protein
LIRIAGAVGIAITQAIARAIVTVIRKEAAPADETVSVETIPEAAIDANAAPFKAVIPKIAHTVKAAAAETAPGEATPVKAAASKAPTAMAAAASKAATATAMAAAAAAR